VIGLVQLPLTLGLTKNLGSSTSFAVLAAALTFWTDKLTYLKKLRGDGNFLKMWWQVGGLDAVVTSAPYRLMF
jgi:hypothetical protein